MRTVRRRVRVGAGLAVGAPAAGIAAFAWIAARFAASAGVLPTSALLPLAIGLAMGVAVLAVGRGLLVRVMDASIVRELDRRAGAAGRLIAVHELSRSPDPFARAAVEEGASAAADSMRRAAALFPVRLPRDLARCAVLVVLAPVAAVVLSNAHWTHAAAPPARADLASAAPASSRGAAAIATPAIPTATWIAREVKTILAPLAAPTTAPTPPAVALAPTPAPRRVPGASIHDPEKRAFFERVFAGASDDTVAKEVGQAFTHEMASDAFKALATQVMAKAVSSGKKYEPGGVGKAMSDPPMPKGAGGGIAPVVDPSKLKSEYMKDRGQDSALAAAVKASFDDYLKQFAKDLLRGMQDALEDKLSGKGTASSARNLPAAHDGAMEDGPEGPAFAARAGEEDGKVTSAGSLSATATGGTQAGGVGAGAGGKDGAQTAAANGGLAGATGSRVDLRGTLDQRLAVVEVVRRMSGGSERIEDSASQEVVAKSTKAAETAAMSSDEVPPEYRGAVASYFRSLSGGAASPASTTKEKDHR